MSFSGFVLICITALLTAAANVLLTKGIGMAGGFAFDGMASLLTGLIRLLLTPVFLFGFVMYFAAAIVWFRVLASESVSVAYPVVVSITFALVTLASGVFLGESATLSKSLGLVAIMLGIAIISLG